MMSTLLSALNRIEHWFQANDPDLFWLLEPGLSGDEIDAIAKDLPFQQLELGRYPSLSQHNSKAHSRNHDRIWSQSQSSSDLA